VSLHKQLMVLGLLQRGPMHGYDLHRVVRAHGELYTDLKQSNVYYLLDRLARDGLVEVHAEGRTRGRRGERLVYALTDAGRTRFGELLRTILGTFEPAHTGLDVAIVFLGRLPRDEAVALLEARRRLVAERRDRVAAELAPVAGRGMAGELAAEHLLSLIDAELAWVERALTRVHEAETGAGATARADGVEGSDHGR
jgi:DNA-binding PadR family transcriptional regulator